MMDSVNDVLQERILLILELVLVWNVVQVTELILVKTDVSLVLLELSRMVGNVKLVLLERSLLELERSLVKLVLVVTHLLPTAKPVCLVEMDSLLNLEVLVNLVLQTATPLDQDHANVLRAVLDLNLMVLRTGVFLVKLVRILLILVDVNCVQLGLFPQRLAPLNVSAVVVVERLIQDEHNVTCVKRDSFLQMKASASIVQHWNTLLI